MAVRPLSVPILFYARRERLSIAVAVTVGHVVPASGKAPKKADAGTRAPFIVPFFLNFMLT